MFLFERVSGTETFSMNMLQVADDLDVSMELGLPLMKILVYSFMFRNVQDMVDLQISVKKAEISQTSADHLELEKELALKRAELGRHERELEQLQQERESYGG